MGKKKVWGESPCEHSWLGVLRRYVGGACCMCILARQRAQYAKDPEKKRVRAKKWFEEHPELVRQRNRERYARDKAIVSARVRAWNEANPDRRRGNSRAWAAKNLDKRRELARRYKGLVWAPGDNEARLRESVGNRCEIPGCTSTSRLVVDHCHATEGAPNVRGLLCNTHNQALGVFGDTVDGLELALTYLRRGIRNPG